MRHLLLGLLIAPLTFGVGAWLANAKKSNLIVHSTTSIGVTSYEHDRVDLRREIFPSPLEATDQFNKELQKAADYAEFSPCFDTSGRRMGERVVVLLFSARVPEVTWRIMWTQQSEDFSEFYWVESTSLSDARRFEAVEREGWNKCAEKKQTSSTKRKC